MSAVTDNVELWIPRPGSEREWPELSMKAPHLVVTMRRYLLQLTTFLAPRSVDHADGTLRQFARWLVTNADTRTVADITRVHIEDYKVWLAAQPGIKGQLLAKNTQRQRLRMIRIFIERLIEWDWPDAPGRNPILHGDIPPRPEPIPRFLTDQQAAAFMAAAAAHPLPPYRLVAQVLAPTGLRATELCELAADAVTRIGDNGYWLRVPVGKLRNDRMIPLHADLVELFADWTATNAEHIRTSGRLLADGHAPIERRTVHRIVARIGATAGINDMHPHRLRHTLATQAINRVMRLEAIAALLGHRSLEMTLVYAKITDRVVADEYASVCEQIDALYATAATPCALPAEIETNAMARLRQEAHARMLGNGMCTRPVELDCRMEPSAKPAPTSTPDPSSSPFCSANETTPTPTNSPTERTSTTASSNEPEHTLDSDHTYNAGWRCRTTRRLRPLTVIRPHRPLLAANGQIAMATDTGPRTNTETNGDAVWQIGL